MERIRPILQAIQQNAAVRVVEFLDCISDTDDFCSFLDTAVQVRGLELSFLTSRHLGAQGARDVAEALRRNTNIATLTLFNIGSFLDTVLDGLASNSCLRNLVIRWTPLTEAIGNALRGLLESSTGSIQHLELGGIRLTEPSFGPIAQGLIHVSMVTEITLNDCTFPGEGSIHLLNQILERKQSLRSLAIKNCIFSRLPQLLEALFSALRRPASPLRHFQFYDQFGDRHPARLSNQSFSNLCQAVAESKLESVAIRVDHCQSRIQSLADTIPSMKIRKLVIELGQYRDGRRITQTLCQAVKNNFTLQSVKYQIADDDAEPFIDPFVDASEFDETMKFCLERNTRLAQWVENPATVPKHLWKEAATLATSAGAETLCRLLRKIGPEVLPVGGRKRKRSG